MILLHSLGELPDLIHRARKRLLFPRSLASLREKGGRHEK